MLPRRGSLPCALQSEESPGSMKDPRLPVVRELTEEGLDSGHLEPLGRRRSNTTPPDFLSGARERALRRASRTRLHSDDSQPASREAMLRRGVLHEIDNLAEFNHPDAAKINHDGHLEGSPEGDLRCDTPRPATPYREASLQPLTRRRANTLSPSSIRKLVRERDAVLPPISRRQACTQSVECIPILEDTAPLVPLPPILKKDCRWLDAKHFSINGEVSPRREAPSPLDARDQAALKLTIEREPLPLGSDALRQVLQELGPIDLDQGSDSEDEERHRGPLRAPKALRELEKQVVQQTSRTEKYAVHKSILIRNGCSYFIGSSRTDAPKDRRRVHWEDSRNISNQ